MRLKVAQKRSEVLHSAQTDERKQVPPAKLLTASRPFRLEVLTRPGFLLTDRAV